MGGEGLEEETTRRLLSTLNEEERNKGLERFRLLAPCIEEHLSFVAISRETGIPVSTLKRWMQLYRKDVQHGNCMLSYGPNRWGKGGF